MVKVSELLDMPKGLRKNPSRMNLNYNSEKRNLDIERKKSEMIPSIPISR